MRLTPTGIKFGSLQKSVESLSLTTEIAQHKAPVIMRMRVRSISFNGLIEVRERYVELTVNKREATLLCQLGRRFCLLRNQGRRKSRRHKSKRERPDADPGCAWLRQPHESSEVAPQPTLP